MMQALQAHALASKTSAASQNADLATMESVDDLAQTFKDYKPPKLISTTAAKLAVARVKNEKPNL